MKRWIAGFGLIAGLSAACEEDDDERNLPPSGKNTTGVISGGLPVASTSDPETGSSSSTGAGATEGTESGSGSATEGGTTGTTVDVLLSGRFINELGEAYPPPVTCSVRFYALGQIEPSTGVSSDVTLQQSFSIEQWPADWAITPQLAGDAIVPGDAGYITAICDTDGDGLTDDGVGGYYPALPLEPLSIPAEGLDIEIGPFP